MHSAHLLHDTCNHCVVENKPHNDYSYLSMSKWSKVCICLWKDFMAQATSFLSPSPEQSDLLPPFTFSDFCMWIPNCLYLSIYQDVLAQAPSFLTPSPEHPNLLPPSTFPDSCM